MDMVLGITAFCWGIIFVFGPTFIRIALEVISKIVPVSKATVYCGSAYIIMVIIIGAIYKSSVGGKICRKLCNEKIIEKRVRKIFRMILSVLHFIGIVGISLLIVNPVASIASNWLNALMIKHAEEFKNVQYFGLVLIIISVGFFISIFYQKCKK